MELPLEVQPAAVAAAMKAGEGPFLLDVREPWEVEICAMPGAVNFPMGTVPGRLAEVPEDRPVVVVCHHGARSMQVTMFLRSRGFDQASNLRGGVDAWARQIDPSMPTY